MPGPAQTHTGDLKSLILQNLLQIPLPKPTPKSLPPAQVQKADTEELRVEKLRILLDRLMPEDDCLLKTPSTPCSSMLSISSAASSDRIDPTTSQMTVSKMKPILPNIAQIICRSCLVAKTTQQLQHQRPNCTYPVLIGLAIYATGTGTATVKGIYHFIANHFDYYRYSCASNWKNSVRHCLSENKAFVKVPTTGGTAARKGCWWTIVLSKKDDLEKDIVQFLGEGSYNLRHIEPLGKFYAEIDFNRAQEGIFLKQALQPGVSSADVLSLGWAGPSAACSAVAAVIPPPQVRQETDLHPAGAQSHSIDSDFQDLLGDIIGSALGEAAARGDCAFDEDLARSLLAEMSTAPLQLNEAAAAPEAAPSAVAEDRVGRNTEQQMAATLSLFNTLDQQDLLKELKDPAL